MTTKKKTSKTFFDYHPDFPRDKSHLVQLCLPREKMKTKKTPQFPLMYSEKLDGVFCFALCDLTSVHIFSRTGEEYLSLEHLKPELYDISKTLGTNIIIFEGYAKGVPQPTISGWCRDTKAQHYEVGAYVHDALSLDEFWGTCEARPYEERSQELNRIEFWQSYHHTFLVPQYFAYTWSEIDKAAERIWNAGGEGLVVRDPSVGYLPGKRNETMMKVKKDISYDLKVLSLQEGTGKYTGMVGALVCQFRGDKEVVVGTGLTDAQRKRWWSEFFYDEIVGKIVQIDAMSESTKGVLREPRFKGIRTDKTEGDF